jgi:hypothetical protein
VSSLVPRRRTVLTVAAIPVAFAVAMGATSQRLVDRWWPSFPHDRLAAAPDGSVRLHDTLTDAKGPHPRDVTMRLVSLERVSDYREAPGAEVQPVTLPPGQVMWRLSIHFAADPSTILGACFVTVRDAEGRAYSPGVARAVKDVLAYPSCTPPGAPGPMPALSRDEVAEPPDPPRPAEYDRWYPVILPAGVRPTSVRVWFDTPRYAEFPVTGS